MLDEIVARYDEMLERLCLDTFAYTVTIPDSGVLTIEDAVRRLGAAVVRPRGEPNDSDRLSLYQVGSGVVTLDWHPVERQEITDRLAGDGFRHWYLCFDIEGNTTMYARYGQAEGYLDHPEPGDIPFTPWTDRFGPLTPYAELLVSGYDSEEAESQTDIIAACLAVIERESGVCLNEDLMDRPHSVVSISARRS